MTIGEATEVAHIIASAWPDRWRSNGRDFNTLYLEFLAGLDDPSAAREVAHGFVLGSSWLPTIAEFREAYLPAARRRRDSVPALEPHTARTDEILRAYEQHFGWSTQAVLAANDDSELVGKLHPDGRDTLGPLSIATWRALATGTEPGDVRRTIEEAMRW